MSSVIKSSLRRALAQSVFNDLTSRRAKYYYFLGKPLQWNPSDAPELPNDEFSYELEARNSIISVKQVNTPDVSLIIPRYDWESGTVYDMYDDQISVENPTATGATKLADSLFYILTTDFNVYKCIWNNDGGKSTEMPQSTSTDIIETSDGYLWKFMYNVPIAFRNKFLTTTYMPVTTAVKNQFYSSGTISNVIVVNSGNYNAVPQLIITGDGYIENNPYIISGITVTDQGEGYTIAPSVSIEAPDVISGSQVQATATATLTGDAVTSIAIDVAGYGYGQQSPSITIDPPFVGVEWQPNTSFNQNEILEFDGRFYDVSTGGITGTTGPVHLTGTVVDGSASLTYLGRTATADVSTVKTNATATAVLTNGTSGEIDFVVVDDGGIGYTTASISIVGGDPVEAAELQIDFNVGDLNTVQSNVELLATSGSIEFIKVLTPGSGYGSVSVDIVGDGIGATADAVLEGGSVTKINITNPGEGYTFATVNIVGNGTGATARAIMSPIGGHGRDAERELFASALMFYTSLAQERNQGFIVNNDYRQFGIVRNIERYGSPIRYADLLGSSCIKVTGSVNTANFPPDTVVTDAATGVKYLVISSESDAMLLLPTDNKPTYVNQLLVNDNNDLFAVEGFTLPDVNNYSGDIFYIDNRAAFIPSPEQSIILRTIIGF